MHTQQSNKKFIQIHKGDIQGIVSLELPFKSGAVISFPALISIVTLSALEPESFEANLSLSLERGSYSRGYMHMDGGFNNPLRVNIREMKNEPGFLGEVHSALKGLEIDVHYFRLDEDPKSGIERICLPLYIYGKITGLEFIQREQFQQH
ncbi:MAG TPA: hypothetical protein VJJ21_01030 [Candidatus Nanoarchaeia archaeon]|nr:hypothetical protein [Candidatus Nanoarchaeia archaeon]